RPAIGAYPFTTRRPHLGIVRTGDDSFVMADIPGLIEGAHEGKGLGLTFLRHISRTRVLCLLIDASGEDHARTHDLLLHELTCYDPELASRPRLVCLTKTDLVPANRIPVLTSDLERAIGIHPVLAVSAVTGTGVPQLLH